ncbi:MAG: hypothetical protein ACTSRS_02390 [Candidatus Helarchaeota archaeon]
MTQPTEVSNYSIPEPSFHYDYLFKVVLLGIEEDVKSGLLWAFTGNTNVIYGYKQVIGVNFGINSIISDQNCIKMQIWDISYEDRMRYLRPQYFKGASGAIVILHDLQNLKTYEKEIRMNCGKIIPLFILYLSDTTAHIRSFLENSQRTIEVVHSGLDGLHWLANVMLTHRTHSDTPPIAIYSIASTEIQDAIQSLYEEQQRSELERLEHLRLKRAKQIEFIKEYLKLMNVPFSNDIVQIFSSKALFEINILTGDVRVFPLQCDQCNKACKKRGNNRLCIVPASTGWSTDLDNNSLLILSSIYAIINNQLPLHVTKQIRQIIRCPFRQKPL